ncbi:hypothetical protein [Granulicella mallensis]|nr:hypothetical protein [Granulicella mallensis]
MSSVVTSSLHSMGSITGREAEGVGSAKTMATFKSDPLPVTLPSKQHEQ